MLIYTIMATTIQISDDIRDQLIKFKLYPRETYNEVLERVLEDMRDLNDRTKKEIEKALKEIGSGHYITHEELGKEMGF